MRTFCESISRMRLLVLKQWEISIRLQQEALRDVVAKATTRM